MALLGKLIADKYRVEELIGESSFGSLYRGTNTLLDRPVAIGVGGEGFIDRAKSAAKISHPNLLNLADVGTDSDGTAYAIYESAPSETLAEGLDREGQLPFEMAIDIARQIGAGLSATHAAGLVHGDLTPANVVVSSSEPGRVGVRVFGFGSDNALHDGSTDPVRFAYLAPEQCSGAEHADDRGDVYSLGVILYQALAGSVPFTGESASELMMRQLEEPPPPLSSFRTDLPAWIEPVILQAMAKNPDARYQTVDSFVNDLANASEVPTAVAASADGSNNLWKTAFVVLAGISLLTIGLIYLTYSRRTDPTTALQPDANGMPVQPINPATGVEEQNLSSLPPEFTYDANSNTTLSNGAVPGDAGNPWLNGNNPPAGGPPVGPGGGTITVPGGGNSPFMNDPNCVPQPSGIMLCTVPVSPTPKPTAAPKATPSTNTNTGTPPATKPTQTPRPASTPAKPASTPGSGQADPNGGERGEDSEF